MTKTININGTDVRIKALGGERVLKGFDFL